MQQLLLKWPMRVNVDNQVLCDFLEDHEDIKHHFKEMDRDDHTNNIKNSYLDAKIVNMNLILTVTVEKELTQKEIELIKKELHGQISDGIFENFNSEQCPLWEIGNGHYKPIRHEEDDDFVEFIRWEAEPEISIE